MPVSDEFSKVSAAKEVRLKAGFSFDLEKPLVVVTGGSQGSERLNKAMAEILPEMMKFASVGLVVGRKHYEKMVDLKKYEVWENAKLKSNFRMWEFNSNMSELLGAADVVVSRAGATTIAELAALKKAVILVPFADLPGAHQVKNAERLESAGAAKVVNDEEMTKKPEVLLEAVRELVRRPKEREKLAENLNKETKTGAAERLAEIVIEAGE
ncbi:UDP-N-acetylglucosamine--N-acetylmuramyl-(pentapeptide) pyrophosphoryl-undecaprenol N-acetylglucosamine transferase [Candidatus Saccharibacteria bacterium]|nr:UDP-N-acetylglucosamine--N-acetylmuramyl-(pentapeptide) pyrophosphoryl-undecaprenol N-acetylglucosamine transferase [Candidatus Saccharibacteria bacterium]